MIPPEVFSSAEAGSTSTRSPCGLKFTLLIADLILMVSDFKNYFGFALSIIVPFVFSSNNSANFSTQLFPILNHVTFW
jgi:hypothetical protein